MTKLQIQTAGENALILYFGHETSPEVAARVQQAGAGIEQALAEKLIDLVPSYASLLVIYNPLLTDHLEVSASIRSCLDTEQTTGTDEGRLVSLPVYYSEESGPDLAAIAERARLTAEEVINLHASSEYRVYAIGFAPGFAYLGQVDQRIAAPRLATPRQRVPRGAVAIADRQTAVYPAPSPGGWNLIGLCPTPMFDPQADPIMPVNVGDRVRFEPVPREEFLRLGGEL